MEIKVTPQQFQKILARRFPRGFECNGTKLKPTVLATAIAAILIGLRTQDARHQLYTSTEFSNRISKS